MTVKLSEDLRRAIEAEPGSPVALLDAKTQRTYMLVPADEYEKLCSLAAEGAQSVREAYAAQERVAAAEGWDDPVMDAYNNYDAQRKASNP